MIKGEIFFAEAPLDFIHFFAVASIKDAQHKKQNQPRGLVLFFARRVGSVLNDLLVMKQRAWLVG